MSKQDWQDRVAVITGAGRGIGAATALEFSSRGANVVLVSRTEAELQEVAKQVQAGAGNGEVYCIPTDMGDPQAIKSLFDQIERRWHRVDFLINNAAVIKVKSFLQTTLEDWDLQMRVNLMGPFLCSQAMLRLAVKAGIGGAIVNVSSLGGIRSTVKFPGFVPYTTSKAGLVGFTEALAVEAREYGVRVNGIAPGAVQTKMLAQAAPHLKTDTHPADLAKMIAYLCDENQSGKLSGTVIEVHSNIE